jgi:DNA-binding CsgD family transcriptional regulator
VLSDRHVRLAREAGALAALPAALVTRSVQLLLAGEFAHAAELAAESTAITRATGARPLRVAELFLAAWSGHDADACTCALPPSSGPVQTGDAEQVLAQYALAVLHNALGEYPAAQQAAARASASEELATSNLALPELVEAAVRAGRPDDAAAALEELGSRARASGTDWGLGLAARSRALTSTGPAAEEHYREAVERLSSCRMATYLARTHLVYGEWLRREGRRQDAREQLRTAHEMLSGMGAEAFAARAARELSATGEHPRARSVQATDALTSQELHIARLVATGATSREVGAQLFLSPRTIEAHLRNIFRKLGITSRRQLRSCRSPDRTAWGPRREGGDVIGRSPAPRGRSASRPRRAPGHHVVARCGRRPRGSLLVAMGARSRKPQRLRVGRNHVAPAAPTARPDGGPPARPARCRVPAARRRRPFRLPVLS